MSDFENLPPPTTFDPTTAVAREMDRLISGVKADMDSNTASFILGALQMGRNILLVLSMSDEELSWVKEVQSEAHRKHREAYERRKPRFDKEAT